jgi:hypothetical protein
MLLAWRERKKIWQVQVWNTPTSDRISPFPSFFLFAWVHAKIQGHTQSVSNNFTYNKNDTSWLSEVKYRNFLFNYGETSFLNWISSLNLPKFQKKGFPRLLFPDLPCPRDKKNWAFPDSRSSIYHACRSFLGHFLSSPEGIPQLNSPFYHPTIPRSSSPNYRHPFKKFSKKGVW